MRKTAKKTAAKATLEGGGGAEDWGAGKRATTYQITSSTADET